MKSKDNNGVFVKITKKEFFEEMKDWKEDIYDKLNGIMTQLKSMQKETKRRLDTHKSLIFYLYGALGTAVLFIMGQLLGFLK